MMHLFGLGSIEKISIKNFEVLTPKVKIGHFLAFQFKLINTDTKKVKIRLEYGVYYQRLNGSLSKKVFKISEKAYTPKAVALIHRKQSFQIITTRKFYCGIHQVSLIINGQEYCKKLFELVK